MFGPDIFTNGDAELVAADFERFDPGCGFEISVFVEDVVSGQQRFVRFAYRFACLEQGGGIVKRLAASFVAIDEADEQGRAWEYPRMERLDYLEVLWNKARFENQVLRRISRHGQLWGQNHSRTGCGKSLVSACDLLKIAAQIPDCRVELSEADLHP